jgi:hypothetical protein
MLRFKEFIEEGKLIDKIKNFAIKAGEHSPAVASNVFTTTMGATAGLVAGDPDLSKNPIAAAALGALGAHLIKDRIKSVFKPKKPKKPNNIKEAKSPKSSSDKGD